MPSSAISQPRALDRGALGRAVDQDRIGVVDVDVDAPGRSSAERGKRAIRLRRSACAPCGGRSCCRFRCAIISSSRYSVPSNNTTSARAMRSHHRGGDRGRARNEGEARAAGRNLDADIGGGLARGLGVLAFEIERHLARHGEQLGLQAARQARAARREPTARRVTRSGASTSNIGLSASAASVAAVAQRAKGSRSRRLSRPATWSISAPVSTTALIGLPRVPLRGCSASIA